MALHHVGTTSPSNGTATYNPAVFEGNQEEQIMYAPALSATATTSVVASPVSNGLSTIDDMASRGIGGIEFDWTSFPMIALKTDGAFEDTSGRSYGKSFTAKMIEAKFKYAHSFDGSKDPKNELIYSYDKITSTLGKSVEDFENGLRAKGKELTCKKYVEIMVELVFPDDDDLDGDFRLLSISPSSVGKYSAFAFKLDRKGVYHSAVAKFSVGEKIRTVANPYFPWEFALAS